MQDTFRGMYWMRFWASLQHEDARKPFDWPAEHWKLFHWTFSPRADGGAIIDSVHFLMICYAQFQFQRMSDYQAMG